MNFYNHVTFLKHNSKFFEKYQRNIPVVRPHKAKMNNV